MIDKNSITEDELKMIKEFRDNKEKNDLKEKIDKCKKNIDSWNTKVINEKVTLKKLREDFKKL